MNRSRFLILACGARTMASRLQESGRQYELVIYARDGLSLPLHRDDRTRRIIESFRAHQVK